MGRPKGSKNRKSLAMGTTTNKVTPVKMAPRKIKHSKKSLFIEDSASEISRSCSSSESFMTESTGSVANFIDDSEFIEEVGGDSAQQQFIEESLSTSNDNIHPVPSRNDAAPIGHDSYPVHEFSLTVTKTKGDIQLCALNCIHSFIKDCCVKGKIKCVFN